MSQPTAQEKLLAAFYKEDYAAIAALVKSGEIGLEEMSVGVREKVYKADPSTRPPGARTLAERGGRRKTRRRRHGRKTRRSRK